MALLWLDGFEQYGASGATGSALETALQVSYDYANVTAPSPDGTLQSGWHTGLCLNWTAYSSSAYLVKYFTSPGDTLIVGFAFKSGTHSATNYLVTWMDNSNNQQASLHLDAYGRLQVTSRNVVTDRLDEPFRNDEWYYIEWKLYCDHTNGTSEIRINGQTVLTIPAHDSYYNNLPTRLKIHSIAGGNNSFDDLYVCNTSGGSFNDFIGPIKVERLDPTADDTSQWTPSAAVDHYTLVDDIPYDGDSTYVESQTTTEKDLFVYSDTSLDVVDLVIVTTTYRTTGESFTMDVICDTGTESTDPVVVSSASFTTDRWEMESPPGGGSWSAVTLNSAKFGFRVS